MTRHCACGKEIGERNASGKCRPCFNRHLNTCPEMAARRSAGVKAMYQRPGVAEARRSALLVAMGKISAEERQRRSDNGKRHARAVLHTPAVKARTFSPDTIARRSAARIETVLGWCPPHLRDDYRYLLHVKHYTAKEARAIVEQMIPGTEAHARRAVANARDAAIIRDQRRKAQAY